MSLGQWTMDKNGKFYKKTKTKHMKKIFSTLCMALVAVAMMAQDPA